MHSVFKVRTFSVSFRISKLNIEEFDDGKTVRAEFENFEAIKTEFEIRGMIIAPNRPLTQPSLLYL